MAYIKYQLDFPMGKVSTRQLWLALSTDTGLSRWVDAEVVISAGIATFKWCEGNIDEAYVLIDNEAQEVRFTWLEDNSGFSLKIERSELTKEVSLIIRDECEATDYDTNSQIWKHQVLTLERILGLPVA